METMHAAGRRRLPPVPRPAGDRQATGQLTAGRPRPVETDVAQADTELIDTRQIAAELVEAELAAIAAASAPPRVTDDPVVEPRTSEVSDDATADDADPDDTDPDDAASDDAASETDGSDPGDTALDDTARFEPVDVLPEESAGTPRPTLEQEQAEIPPAAADEPPAYIARPAADRHPAEVAQPVVEPQPEGGGPAVEPERPEIAVTGEDHDPAQQFVARLRSSAADFAGAAGAESAVVREAVPPARHRRARCRLVLRYADGSETDVTLLGPAGRPGRPSRHGFDRQILRWLGSGLTRDAAWLIDDPDAPDGIAIDLSAWVATG